MVAVPSDAGASRDAWKMRRRALACKSGLVLTVKLLLPLLLPLVLLVLLGLTSLLLVLVLLVLLSWGLASLLLMLLLLLLLLVLLLLWGMRCLLLLLSVSWTALATASSSSCCIRLPNRPLVTPLEESATTKAENARGVARLTKKVGVKFRVGMRGWSRLGTDGERERVRRVVRRGMGLEGPEDGPHLVLLSALLLLLLPAAGCEVSKRAAGEAEGAGRVREGGEVLRVTRSTGRKADTPDSCQGAVESSWYTPRFGVGSASSPSCSGLGAVKGTGPSQGGSACQPPKATDSGGGPRQ